MIEVADAGQGFESSIIEEQQGSGFGLRTIRERVALFEGDLSIVSAPGAGTTVTMRFPCTSGEEEPRKLGEEE